MSGNQDIVTAFLAQKGLTPAQVAGAAGNLKVESGFSPTAYNAREGAIGIAQWEGSRRTALQAYARRTGGSETSLSTQLGFLWAELNGSESSAFAKFRKTTTPTQAAAVWDQYFERSSGEARAQRERYAREIAATLPNAASVKGGTQLVGLGGLGDAAGAVGGALGDAAGAVGGFLGDQAGNVGDAVGGAVTDAIAASMKAAWSVAGDLVVKGGFMAFGLGLVALGAYRLSQSSPTVAAAGHAAAAPVRAAKSARAKVGGIATTAATKGAVPPPAPEPKPAKAAPPAPRPRPAATAEVAPF